MNQGNTARSTKVQFLKMFFWIPFIAVIAVIFPISRSRRPNSRYRDDRDLSVCLALTSQPSALTSQPLDQNISVAGDTSYYSPQAAEALIERSVGPGNR